MMASTVKNGNDRLRKKNGPRQLTTEFQPLPRFRADNGARKHA